MKASPTPEQVLRKWQRRWFWQGFWGCFLFGRQCIDPDEPRKCTADIMEAERIHGRRIWHKAYRPQP